MKLKCWLGFHNDEWKRELVFQSEFVETYNSWFVCKNCGRKTEKTGCTHFGPMKIRIK